MLIYLVHMYILKTLVVEAIQ